MRIKLQKFEDISWSANTIVGRIENTLTNKYTATLFDTAQLLILM